MPSSSSRHASISDSWNPALIGAEAFLALAGSGLGIYLVRTYEFRISRRYANLLEKKLLSGTALEKDGVQFNARVVPSAGGEPHWIELFLQNSFNRPRHVRILFEAVRPSETLQLHAGHEVDLDAAEVTRLRFPVVTPDDGSYGVFKEVDVAGSGGIRVRRWKGSPAKDRVERSEAIQAAAEGKRLVGGGLEFTLGPIPGGLPNGPLPEVQVTSIWKAKQGMPEDVPQT